MAKKGAVGVIGVGTAIIGLRPLARRAGRGIGEHCGRMVVRCKHLAAQCGGRGAAVVNN